MKIEQVEVFGVAVPLSGKYETAHHASSIQTSAVVRITATGGAVGLGNVDPVAGYSEETIEDTLHVLRTVLAPRVLGTDPTNISRMLERLNADLAGHLDAKAAIEMACVDLTARACNVPVHVFLGGAVKEKLLFNAWVGMLRPDEAAEQTLAWKKRGFKSAKIKVGKDVGADCARVAAVREAVGPDFQLRIDANAGYDVAAAVELARKVAQFDLQLFEQPVAADDIAGLAEVRRRAAGIPIMADESLLDHASLIRLIRADAVDMIKVKVMKQGGIYSTIRMIATAEAAGIPCVLGHGFGLGINTMAEIMVAATSRNVIDGLECVGPLKTSDDIVAARIDLGSGSLELPAGIGLGVSLDADKLRRYRFEG